MIGSGLIMKFLFKNWQAIALVLLVLSIAGYHKYRTHQIETLTKENISLTQSLAIMEGNFNRCQAKITERNKEIEFWVNKGRQQKGEIDKLKGQLDTTKKKYDDAASSILKDNVPKNCQGAMDYLLKGRGDLKW